MSAVASISSGPTADVAPSMTALACPECGAPMLLKWSNRYDRPFYGCSRWERAKCPGTHGAHPDGTPMGIPADQATKAARHQLHLLFDQLWKSHVMSRAQAYQWLMRAINTDSRREAHIARFSIAQCERVLTLLRDEFPALPPWTERVDA